MHFYKLPTCPPNKVEPAAVQPMVYENMYYFPHNPTDIECYQSFNTLQSEQRITHSFHVIQQTHIMSENINNLLPLLLPLSLLWACDGERHFRQREQHTQKYVLPAGRMGRLSQLGSLAVIVGIQIWLHSAQWECVCVCVWAGWRWLWRDRNSRAQIKEGAGEVV